MLLLVEDADSNPGVSWISVSMFFGLDEEDDDEDFVLDDIVPVSRNESNSIFSSSGYKHSNESKTRCNTNVAWKVKVVLNYQPIL